MKLFSQTIIPRLRFFPPGCWFILRNSWRKPQTGEIKLIKSNYVARSSRHSSLHMQDDGSPLKIGERNKERGTLPQLVPRIHDLSLGLNDEGDATIHFSLFCLLGEGKGNRRRM